MEDLPTLVFRGLKTAGKSLLVLLDLTNMRDGIRALRQDGKRPKTAKTGKSKKAGGSEGDK
ncbi:hypothetical protein [Streptomyces sp. NPDC101776]|uniref:hypothetical protein n=1 Tax=Streptomyces sp. NPDC101776 TaxID=3366146 RepID=UPI00381BB06F